MKTELKTKHKRFYVKTQISAIHTIAERVFKLRKDIAEGINADDAQTEIGFLQGFCSEGFSMSKFKMPEVSGDDPSMQPGIAEMCDAFWVIWKSVMDGYNARYYPEG